MNRVLPIGLPRRLVDRREWPLRALRRVRERGVEPRLEGVPIARLGQRPGHRLGVERDLGQPVEVIDRERLEPDDRALERDRLDPVTGGRVEFGGGGQSASADRSRRDEEARAGARALPEGRWSAYGQDSVGLNISNVPAGLSAYSQTCRS